MFYQGLHGSTDNGLVELVLIEGRDLFAADLRGTSDPYVRVHYGNLKRRTKVRKCGICKIALLVSSSSLLPISGFSLAL